MFVDPSCPWAWITSLWVKEVAPQRDLAVTWRSYCLEIRDDYGVAPTVPEHLRDAALAGHAISHRMLRIFEAARARVGEEAVDALYTDVGPPVLRRQRSTGRRPPLGVRRRVRASTRSRGCRRRRQVGRADPRGHGGRLRLRWAEDPDADDRGPGRSALRVQGPGDGARARPVPPPLRLWDAVQVVAAEPGFFEITRPRSNRPVPPTPI